jgi:hypothetical protein
VRTFFRTLVAAAALAGAAPALPADEGVAAQNSQAETYRVRLEAFDTGQFVASKDVSVTASTQLEFINAVGSAQAVFGQELNAQRKRWNRISYRVLP